MRRRTQEANRYYSAHVICLRKEKELETSEIHKKHLLEVYPAVSKGPENQQMTSNTQVPICSNLYDPLCGNCVVRVNCIDPADSMKCMVNVPVKWSFCQNLFNQNKCIKLCRFSKRYFDLMD